MKLSIVSLVAAAGFIDCASAALGGTHAFKKAEKIHHAHRERLAKRAAEYRPAQSHASLETRQSSPYLNAATESELARGVCRDTNV